MLKVISDFTPYGAEFIDAYPHLVERSQSSRSSKDVDFSRLLDTTMKRNTTPNNQTAQPYQLSPVPWSTLKNTADSHQILSVPQQKCAFPVDEELYVRNNTVIWSRGRHIIKTFQYELQTVELALFAWFPIDQHDIETDDLLFTDTNLKRKNEFGDEQPSKKKRQSITSTSETVKKQSEGYAHSHTWTSFIPTSQDDTGDQSNNTKKTLQKAVCILLKDCMKIHFLDGKHYSIHLPFTTGKIIPSDIGLIFERAKYSVTSNITNRRYKNNDSFADYTNSFTGKLPSLSMTTSTNQLKASPFLCLIHPAEDLKPIFFLDELSPPSSFFSGSGPDFFQQQQLVYASFTMDYTYDNDSQLPTLVVTRSKDTGLHSIWRYQSIKYNQMDSSDEDALDEETKFSMHATPSFADIEEQHRRSKQEQTGKLRKHGKRSKKSTFSTKSSKRRPKKQEKQQQPQKQQASPPSPHGGNSNINISYHSASPSPSLTTRKDSFLAASLSFIHNDDDVSNIELGGNGDSYSMMALYQDALDTEKGEKCLLQPIWKEQRHISASYRSTVSKGFISHNSKGLATLCIMNETEGTLLGFVIQDLLSQRHAKSNLSQQSNPRVAGFHFAVKQALPVRNATRSGGVADILYLDHQNKMFLFVDSQLPSLPISPCAEEYQQGQNNDRIIKLQDAVDNRFNMVTTVKDINGMPKYNIKRCQINTTLMDSYCKSSNQILVASGNMALRCAWSSSLLWFFFQHHSLKLLQMRQNDNFDGWKTFVVTLMSMIPLSLAIPGASIAATTIGGKHDEKVLNFYIQCLQRAYKTQNEHETEEIYYISDSRDIASVMYALHILYQEYCLSKFISKETLVLLGTLLWVLSLIVRSERWMDFYREYGSPEGILLQLDTSSLKECLSFDTTVEGKELIFLSHPFHFESWVHYHLPHDYSASLQQLSGVPTLDPDTVYTPTTTVNSDITVPTSNNSKIQRRHGDFCFKLKMIWYIHQTMYYYLPNGDYSSAVTNMQATSSPPLSLNMGQKEWIKAVMKKGYCRNDLEMVPDTCILLDPLLDAITQLQLNPPLHQSTDFYKFIGRYDMVAQLDYYRIGSNLNNTSTLSLYRSKLLRFSLHDKNDQQRQVPNLDHRDSDWIMSQLSYGGSGSTLDKLKHVRAMLNPCRLVEITVPDRPGISQDSLDTIIQGHMKHLIQRTLSLSMGNGIFHYGHQHLSHLPSSNLNNSLSTELPSLGASSTNTSPESGNRSLTAIEEKMSISAKLLPLRTVVTLDEKTYRPEYFNWPRFHHGVATGLRLSSPRASPTNKDRNENESGPMLDLSSGTGYMDDGLLGGDKNDLCWLFYVEPEELNVFHGGLIFGLGLNGHLLPNSRWYRYITQTKCSLVTIGFILGTCVTFRGTKNAEITKILSVHVPALLNPSTTASAAAPAGTINTAYGINTPANHRIRGEDALMTSCCLFGFGLVYMGSCDRYMISVMLNEIGYCSKRANSNYSIGINAEATSLGSGSSSNNMESACALAAGFALGFIALGKGGSVSKEQGGLSDTQLSDTLYNFITGHSSNANNANSSPTVPAPSVSSSSAIPTLNRYQAGQRQRTERKRQRGETTAGQHHNRGTSNLLDITAPAATVALGLIYLKTENHRIAQRLDICDTTRPYLNYVRPDFLLIRIVAKNLILWKSITPSQAWIDDQLPTFMRSLHQQRRDTQHGDAYGSTRSFTVDATTDDVNSPFSIPPWEDQVINQAKFNVIAGACLCLGLRFAGSHDAKAFDCLLDQFDMFMELAAVQATGFQEQITRSAIWVSIDVIATAAAMVMAGSGHEGLYRRLKVLHDRIPFSNADNASNIGHGVEGATGHGNYGDHTASHMAMGLLFCGLGRYTLKTTNEAIAGLLCAFYPFYPLDPEDQRSHLQALRHLWIIGMDQRWLTPFDCDTKLPCQVPLLITMTSSSATGSSATRQMNTDLKSYGNAGGNQKNGIDSHYDGVVSMDDSIRGKCAINTGMENANASGEGLAQTQEELGQCRVVAPSIVPNYDCIQNIQLDSSLYCPLSVNMQTKSEYQQAIRQSGILFVQRRK